MNYFVEGLQGSGKSTLVSRLAETHPACAAVREGEYSPVELAWCAYADAETYRGILERYPGLRTEIEAETHAEADRRIICYTRIATDNRAFYRDLERYEIYNGRKSFDAFRSILLDRYRRWNGDHAIFECSLLQNTVEDMTLFRNASDEAILELYAGIRDALAGKDYRIVYLRADDVRGNLAVIRKERSDAAGNELWFPMMRRFFDESPYAVSRGVSGDAALIEHFVHRQELELRICREIFPDRSVILPSKRYGDADLAAL